MNRKGSGPGIARRHCLEQKRCVSKERDGDEQEAIAQWSGDCKKARAELVTDDFNWVERARTEGQPVGMEIGRWDKIPKDRGTTGSDS